MGPINSESFNFSQTCSTLVETLNQIFHRRIMCYTVKPTFTVPLFTVPHCFLPHFFQNLLKLKTSTGHRAFTTFSRKSDFYYRITNPLKRLTIAARRQHLVQATLTILKFLKTAYFSFDSRIATR